MCDTTPEDNYIATLKAENAALRQELSDWMGLALKMAMLADLAVSEPTPNGMVGPLDEEVRKLAQATIEKAKPK